MSTSIGVEIEAIFPDREATYRLREDQVGYHHEFRQARDFPRGWMAQTDSSIHSEEYDTFTAELVSPVMRWPDALDQVAAVVERARELGAKTNYSCGFHVHLGADDLDGGDLDRLIALTRRYEFALYGTAGTSVVSRMASEHGRHYCKPSTYGVGWDDHYWGLNLSNVRGPRFHTVEYRMFQCSMMAERLLGPMALAVAIKEAALDYQSEEIPAERIVGPVAAMEAFIVGPLIDYAPLSDARFDAIQRTLTRQARKAEVRLGLV